MGKVVRDESQRLVGLDLLRVVSALAVFLFHSDMHAGDYGIMNRFVSTGFVFMTAFFMLSGFSLYYTNAQSVGLADFSQTVGFYKKRIISIMPIYWSTVFCFPIYDKFVRGGRFLDNIILFPIEFLGLQSVFHTVAGKTHNGGTWFVSCMILCYIGFPLFRYLIGFMRKGVRAAAGLLIGFVLLYSPIIVRFMGIESTYSNPFFRMLEFILGMLAAAVWIDMKDKPFYAKWIAKWTSAVLGAVLLVGILSWAGKPPVIYDNYMLYSWISIPAFFCLLLCLAGVQSPGLSKSKLLKYLAKISYAFFFAQFYTWKLTDMFMVFVGMDNNAVRIGASLAICMGISIAMHELVEKPVRKVLIKILYK